MSELEELRALVREVIRDVLPQGLAVTETVNLSTDEDLTAFVKRLMDLDPGQREELRSGRKRFRLASPQAPSVPAVPPIDSPVSALRAWSVERACVRPSMSTAWRLTVAPSLGDAILIPGSSWSRT